MQESAEDLAALDALLKDSIADAGPFLRSSFQMPNHALTAAQVAGRLQGALMLAFATVTARGKPRVAPITGLFYKGHFYVPTTADAARARMIRANPAVSLSYFEGKDLALIVHGTCETISPNDPEFERLNRLQLETGGQSPLAWGKGLFLKVNAEKFFTFVADPEQVGPA